MSLTDTDTGDRSWSRTSQSVSVSAKLPVGEVHDLVRVAGERVRVAREVSAVFAHTDNKGTAQSRADDQSRLGLRHHRDAVGALHQRERLSHGRGEVALVVVADEVRENFGVGVRAEQDAGGSEVAA